MSSFSGGDDEPSAAEWAVATVSVAVTLLLFGYVAYHAATVPPGATPGATIEGTETTADGRVLVTVEVHNVGSTGLESVTVSADCTTASLTFEHLPADARRSGTLVCPAGTEGPTASVLAWIEVGRGG